MTIFLRASLALILLANATGIALHAQTVSVLASFNPNVASVNPVNPNAGLVQGNDGNFYGTTTQGGAYNEGTVFKITPSGVITTLASFNGTNGSTPEAALIQASDGNFYGTASQGGAYNQGTVFRITPAGAMTTLLSFNFGTGGYPLGALLQASDGSLYGTTSAGGFYFAGTVFKMSLSGIFTTCYSFYPGPRTTPSAALIQTADGSFYGTTEGGGNYGCGTVFKMDPNGVVTTLHSFGNAKDGAGPVAALVRGQDGNFYGTATSGGADAGGVIFRMTPSGAFTTIHVFKTDKNGGFPSASLIQATDGNFYGTTARGGPYGDGTAFRVTPSGTLTTLTSLAGSNFQGSISPAASLIQASDGNIYGTLLGDGFGTYGSIFKISLAGVVETFFSFCGASCASPDSLIQGSDGDLYGTTLGNFASAVFKVDHAGTLTPLTTVGDFDGPFINGVVQGTDGNFYGTTQNGGTSSQGSIFKVTPTGVLTTLNNFTGSNGGQPFAGLVQGTDGNFYGSTTIGGAYGAGTVFEVDPTGKLTTLVPLGLNEGSRLYPNTALVQGADGDFYATTAYGSLNGYGGVIKVTPSGVLTSFASFNHTDGSEPNSLFLAPDGNFYGTTYSGGLGDGTVFKLTSAGALTTVYAFSGTGLAPTALVSGHDGNFYGTTTGGETSLGGTVFRISPTGTFTTLASYSGEGRILQANDGNLYGFDTFGGPDDAGDIFEIALQPPVAQSITAADPGKVVYGQSVTLNATANSGLPVVYTLVSGPGTLVGQQLSFSGFGKVSIALNQPGNLNFTAAPTVTQTIQMAKAPQAIDFPAIPNQTWQPGPVYLDAAASSGLGVTYKIHGPAALSGGTLNLTGTGTVTVAAYQPGNVDYTPAPEVRQTFTVTSQDLPQTITFPAVGG